MRFEQVDGSLIGGSPVTHQMQLKIGQHQETICFIIKLKMTVAVILGLSWWQKGEKKMKLGQRLPPATRVLGEAGKQREEGEVKHLKVILEQLPGILFIPKEYRDLGEVFSKKECDVLTLPSTDLPTLLTALSRSCQE